MIACSANEVSRQDLEQAGLGSSNWTGMGTASWCLNTPLGITYPKSTDPGWQNAGGDGKLLDAFKVTSSTWMLGEHPL